MYHAIRQVGKRVVPSRYHHVFRKRWPVERFDVVSFDVQEDVRLSVYWKHIVVEGHADERGPVISAYARGKEVLRYDCFGPTGHYHLHPINSKKWGGELRIYLLERTVPEQIERAVGDLSRNFREYLRADLDPRVRAVSVDQEALDLALGRAREKMLEYISVSGAPV